jgi:hypothetical protein
MAEELIDLVRKLQVELAETPRLGKAAAESLEKLAVEIHQKVAARSDSSTSEATGEASLSGQVQSMVDNFEMQHPRLTQILSVISERLADMGI